MLTFEQEVPFFWKGESWPSWILQNDTATGPAIYMTKEQEPAAKSGCGTVHVMKIAKSYWHKNGKMHDWKSPIGPKQFTWRSWKIAKIAL